MEKGDCINENSTLDEVISYYLNNHVKNFYAISTYKSYKTKMDKYVLPYIGAYEVKKLKKLDVQNLIYHLVSKENSLSANSIRQVYSILHKILNYLVNFELIDKNVSVGVKLPEQAKYSPKIYSKTDVTRLLEKAKDNFLYLPICLAVKLGLRRSEILSLQWSDVNFENGTITIRKGKKTGTKSRHSTRTLKITNSLCLELKKHKENQLNLLKENGYTQTAETLLICKKDGEPYNPTFVSRKFSELLISNNLPAIRFHDLRHPYVKPTLKNIIKAIERQMLNSFNNPIFYDYDLDIYNHTFLSNSYLLIPNSSEAL